jgi:hypothetical protein
MWWRIFGLSETPAPLVALVEALHAAGLQVVPHFRGDDLGWTNGELVLPGSGTPVHLDRYLTQADHIRQDLNTFAAELETMDYSPHNTRLMQHVIQTQQLIAFRQPIDHSDEQALDKLCEITARFLASQIEGVYQVDGQGWFAADGTRLIEEY